MVSGYNPDEMDGVFQFAVQRYNKKMHSYKIECKITAFLGIDQLYLPQNGIEGKSGQKWVKNGSKSGHFYQQKNISGQKKELAVN